MFKLVILIPAFNEEKTIGGVISGLPKNINGIASIEVLVMDDGSTDKTVEISKKNGAFTVSHGCNRGVGAALVTGIENALEMDADIVVNMDADGQFSASDIERLLIPILNKEADVVVGNRFDSHAKPENMPTVKYYGNKVMSMLVSMLIGEHFQDVSSGFRAYSKEAMLNLNLFGSFTYTQETFLDMKFKGLRIKEVPVDVKYFGDRKSKVAGSILKYAYNASAIILKSLAFHNPFKFFGMPAFVLVILGVAFTGFLLMHKIIFGTYTPYKAYGFIGAGFMMFGLILFFLAFVANAIDRLKKIQEKVLYYEKKRLYDKQ